MTAITAGLAGRRPSRPRMRAGLLDRYLIATLLPVLATCFALIFVAMMLERGLRLLDEMASNGAHLAYLVPILGALAPYYVGLALPTAFTVALLLVVSRLDAGSEIEVMLAAGRPLGRIAIPLLVVAAALAGLSLLNSAWLQPEGWYAYRTLRAQALDAGLRARLHGGAIQMRGPDVVVTADQAGGEGTDLKGVFISRQRGSGQTVLVAARSGVLRDDPGGGGVDLTLRHGMAFREQPGHRPESVRFTAYTLHEPAPDAGARRPRGIDQKELTLGELVYEIARPSHGFSRPALLAEAYGRLARAATLLLAPFLALPLGMAAKRGGRVLGLASALVLLSMFQHGLNFAQAAAARGAVDPALAVGGVCGLFTAVCVWAFAVGRRSPGATPLAAVTDAARAMFAPLRPAARGGMFAAQGVGGYVARTLAMWTLAAIAALVSLLLAIDLLERTGEILGRGQGWSGVAQYAVLRLPEILEQSFSLGGLAGASLAFLQLSASSEVVAMRAGGVSLRQIVGMAMPVAATFALAAGAVGLWIAPVAQQHLSRWWLDTGPQAQADPPLWFRIGPTLASAGRVSPDGRRIDGLTLYLRNAQGDLLERTQASAAVFDHDWRLAGLTVTRFGAREAFTTREIQAAPPRLAPADLAVLASGAPLLAAPYALRALRGEAPSNRSPAFYETTLHRALAAPIAIVVMMLLAAPLALVSPRTGPSPLLVVTVLGLGLIYLVSDGVLTVMAQTQLIPPWLGAWAAPALFAAIAGAFIVYREA